MHTRGLLSPCVWALSLAVVFHNVTLNHIHEGTCSPCPPSCYLYKAEAQLHLATALTCLCHYFQDFDLNREEGPFLAAQPAEEGKKILERKLFLTSLPSSEGCVMYRA